MKLSHYFVASARVLFPSHAMELSLSLSAHAPVGVVRLDHDGITTLDAVLCVRGYNCKHTFGTLADFAMHGMGNVDGLLFL